MNSPNLGLQLYVQIPYANSEEIDQLTHQLMNEIDELGIASVNLLKEGPVPDGAKGIEAVTVGGIALTVLPTIIPKLVEFLQNWLMRGEGRKIKIKTQLGDRSVELEYSPSAMSRAELQALIDTLTGALIKKPLA